MSFSGDLKAFAEKAERLTNGAFVSTAVELQKSIKFGSGLTGAPPMPVAQRHYGRPGGRKRLPPGTLRDSVTLTFPTPTEALIDTTQWYAPLVEDNTQGHSFDFGGPHGWKLTIAGFERVVDAVVARQKGAR